MPDPKLPVWIGILDVTLAFLLVVTGFALYGTTRTVKLPKEEATLGIIQGVSGIALLLLLIFLTGWVAFRWDILLPGLAWRFWLAIMVIPALMKIFFEEQEPS